MSARYGPSTTMRLVVDKHIHVDNRFIMGIECKAYTENAMLEVYTKV